ncbi:MAG: AAA family ATPase [Bacteroidales bacterium]|nr:AAA family ATPase [Bacteroidales bacterium]
MLKNFFVHECQRNLTFKLTEDQNKALLQFAEFLFNPKAKIFILNGYAGTGKTTLIKLIVQNLKKYKRYVLLAPTGRAAKVLSVYCNEEAFTIHKFIYRQKSLTDFRFVLNYDVPANTIFFVDEASLISNDVAENNVFGSGRLLNDLLEFALKHETNKIVFIGDMAQLPPVGSNFHPALNVHSFSRFNEIGFAELKEVVRQEDDSNILTNATELRYNIETDVIELPRFTYSEKDFEWLNSSDILDKISNSYNDVGMEETIILTYSNKRALQINRAIRNQIFFYDEEVVTGEWLMVVKNNYMPLPPEYPFNFIANGEMMRVNRVKKLQLLYDFRFLIASVQFANMTEMELDVILLLDTLHSSSPSLTKEEFDKLFTNIMEDYSEEVNIRKRIQKVKENKYFNAIQVKYAYAVTTHKAQGGQWKHVYIDASFLHYTEITSEILKWFYTSLTRATEKVYIFGLPEKLK